MRIVQLYCQKFKETNGVRMMGISDISYDIILIHHYFSHIIQNRLAQQNTVSKSAGRVSSQRDSIQMPTQDHTLPREQPIRYAGRTLARRREKRASVRPAFRIISRRPGGLQYQYHRQLPRRKPLVKAAPVKTSQGRPARGRIWCQGREIPGFCTDLDVTRLIGADSALDQSGALDLKRWRWWIITNLPWYDWFS